MGLRFVSSTRRFAFAFQCNSFIFSCSCPMLNDILQVKWFVGLFCVFRSVTNLWCSHYLSSRFSNHTMHLDKPELLQASCRQYRIDLLSWWPELKDRYHCLTRGFNCFGSTDNHFNNGWRVVSIVFVGQNSPTCLVIPALFDFSQPLSPILPAIVSFFIHERFRTFKWHALAVSTFSVDATELELRGLILLDARL